MSELANNNMNNLKNAAFMDILYMKYPELNGKLIFSEGFLHCENNIINIDDLDLESIPLEYYQMKPKDIFTYIKNHFYNHNPENYLNEIANIRSLFDKEILDANDINNIINFAKDYKDRYNILMNDSSNTLSKDKDYILELKHRGEIANIAYTNYSMASTVFIDEYTKIQTPGYGQSNDKKLALVNEDFPQIINTEGFSSTILIVLIVIVVGILLALLLI